MQFIKYPDKSNLTTKQQKMPRKEILNDIPTSDLSDVIADFESEGAKVDIRQERHGNWVLIAIFEK
uniref:Uncharacterized protein n=1 Tax=Candidatus Kentrum sp. MB TaxID=2138164 RepID=A0A450XMP0_9GAMM|nr:MAG: hypothetical protein BECKMB1821G_GA0114241_100766 [Candidatus Kentron sp. MB]VFK30600.1 MAG: hypothetical protein BECKMB1821I_GA0114274_101649 [Candidatus Kentron sp. MB]VFK75316.1 MAG: hypothetical protein BECKMB1821H_GA0114242_101948 [Candidatus Kentron sp. MB]